MSNPSPILGSWLAHRQRLHDELRSDVEAFLAAGGRVTKLGFGVGSGSTNYNSSAKRSKSNARGGSK